MQHFKKPASIEELVYIRSLSIHCLLGLILEHTKLCGASPKLWLTHFRNECADFLTFLLAFPIGCISFEWTEINQWSTFLPAFFLRYLHPNSFQRNHLIDIFRLLGNICTGERLSGTLSNQKVTLLFWRNSPLSIFNFRARFVQYEWALRWKRTVYEASLDQNSLEFGRSFIEFQLAQKHHDDKGDRNDSDVQLLAFRNNHHLLHVDNYHRNRTLHGLSMHLTNNLIEIILLKALSSENISLDPSKNRLFVHVVCLICWIIILMSKKCIIFVRLLAIQQAVEWWSFDFSAYLT